MAPGPRAAAWPPHSRDPVAIPVAHAGMTVRCAINVVICLTHLSNPGTCPEWHRLSPQICGPVLQVRADNLRLLDLLLVSI